MFKIYTMVAKQQICIVAGSIAGLSAVAYLIYQYIRAKSFEVKTSRPARIEVRVPQKCAASVIGRGGTLIKSLERETGTKIIDKKELNTEEFRFFEIRGSSANAQLAEMILHTYIQAQAEKETQNMFIPHIACGRIIGKNGRTIQCITYKTGTKIKLESETVNEQGQHKVSITGTLEQIEKARSMISEIVSRSTKAVAVSQNSHKQRYKRLGVHEGPMEVCVSAVESPSRFWVQVLGPQTLDLDRLEEQMTKYYCRVQQLAEEVLVGQLVAAPGPATFEKCNKWYRAKVKRVLQNENKVTLFYVDYGDTATIERYSVYVIDKDFLTLDFQAVECRLANALPKLGKWTDGAKQYFNVLCHSHWNILEAVITNLKSEESVLAIELYDRENGISILDEMVQKGFAEQT